MRPGSNITITFDDGTVFQGQLGNCQMREAETMRFEDVGGRPASHVVTRPASMVLEVYSRDRPMGLEPIRRGPIFSPRAPEPAPEPEDVPENWGAYA